MSKKGLGEFLKSIGRAIWFSVLGVVSAFLVSILASPDLLALTWTLPFVGITLPAGVWIASGITLIVKAIDRWIYLSKSKSNGIALPFLQK